MFALFPYNDSSIPCHASFEDIATFLYKASNFASMDAIIETSLPKIVTCD
jgi:hypothetical protein